MTFEELTNYFDNKQLPAQLRLDRAAVQSNLAEQIKYLLQNMEREPQNWRHEDKLTRIVKALEHPYDGPGIPRF
jgi:hypothetical protein